MMDKRAQYRVVVQSNHESFQSHLNELASEEFRVIHFQLGEQQTTGMEAQVTRKDVLPLYVAVMEREIIGSG